MNFGIIKENLMSKLLETLYLNEEDKEFNNFYNKYLNKISKDVLMLEYLTFSYLTTTKFDDEKEAEKYLNEILSVFKEFKKSDIKKLNKNLQEFYIERENNNGLLLEAIQELIYINCNNKFNDANKKYQYQNIVIENLLKKEPIIDNEINEELKVFKYDEVAKILTKKINEKVSTLNETELKIVKAVLNNDKEGLENSFNEVKKLATDVVNDKYKDSDLREEVLEKLNSMECKEENLYEILNLIS